MRNRYRIEIYDDIKSNDVTLYSDQGVDKDLLTEYVFSNVTKFSSTVHAYVFDTQRKKKTTAMFLPMETVQRIKSKLTAGAVLIQGGPVARKQVRGYPQAYGGYPQPLEICEIAHTIKSCLVQ